MRVVVTGATGFLGTNLVALLLERGHSVTGFHLPEEDIQTWVDQVGDLVDFYSRGGLDFEAVRDSLDTREGSFDYTETLSQLIESHDAVCHLAGCIAGDSRARYMEANAGLVEQLLAASTWTDSHLLVHVSSVAANGPGSDERLLTEEDGPAPFGLYGETKLAGEEVLLSGDFPGRFLILRPPSIFGPRDRNFLEIFLRGRQGFYPNLGPPGQRFQLVYVRDLAVAIERVLAVLEREQPPRRIYQLGPEQVLTPEAWRAELELVFDRPIRQFDWPGWLTRLLGLYGHVKEALTGTPEVFGSDKAATMLLPHWVHSFSRFDQEIGGVEWTGHFEACRRTNEWYVRHEWY